MIFAGLCHLPGYLCLQWYWDASLPAPLSAKGSWQSLCNKASLAGIVSQYGINIWHATRSCKEPIASPNKDDNNLTQLLRFSVLWENRRREFLSEQRFYNPETKPFFFPVYFLSKSLQIENMQNVPLFLFSTIGVLKRYHNPAYTAPRS